MMRRVLLLAASVVMIGCSRRAAEAPAPEAAPVRAAAAVPAPAAPPVVVKVVPPALAPAVTLAPKVAAPAPVARAVAPAPRAVAAKPPETAKAEAVVPAPRAKVEEPAPRQAARPVPQPKPEPEPAPEVERPAEPEVPAVAVGVRDLEDIRVFIDTVATSGRMPSRELTRAALAAAGSPAAELVKGKAIVLTGVTTREGVWAYEAAALTRGGLVAGTNGVETLSADELRRRLGVER
jgi:hypothetical protein